MKAQVILLLLLSGLITTNAFATESDPKEEVKKTQKSKYDFNIFKLYYIDGEQEPSDSLKLEIKAVTPNRKKD